MVFLWDPRAVLGVDPSRSVTCVGTNQKLAPCGNRVNQADLEKASRLLDRMARMLPRQARSKLRTLALLTLCVGVHRRPSYSQIDLMVDTWWYKITRYYFASVSLAPPIHTTQQLDPGSTPRSPSLPRPALPSPPPSPTTPSTPQTLRPASPEVLVQPVALHLHIQRRPIEDCPVCMDDISCTDDAVWCRAQCGNNVHRGCFVEWAREKFFQGAPITCISCRGTWKFEWEE